MSRIKLGVGTSSATWYVTFPANPRLVAYQIHGVLYGNTDLVPEASFLTAANIISDDPTAAVATMQLGATQAAAFGHTLTIPGGPIYLNPSSDAFVTVTWAAVHSGMMAVLYDILEKAT